jgi:hypothetical protein
VNVWWFFLLYATACDIAADLIVEVGTNVDWILFIYLFCIPFFLHFKKKLSHFVLVKNSRVVFSFTLRIIFFFFLFMTKCVYIFVEALLVTLFRLDQILCSTTWKIFNLCENQCRKLNTLCSNGCNVPVQCSITNCNVTEYFSLLWGPGGNCDFISGYALV